MAKIKIKTDRENKRFIIGIWILICAAAKFVQMNLLSAKYSYDGERILLEASTGYRSGDKGFDTASNFFAFMNKIFFFRSYKSWALFLGIVGSIILIYFIYDSMVNLYILEFIFLSCSLFLMNIYIFNAGKEIIQILIMIPIVYILKSKYKTKTKIIVIVSSFLCIAYFLRVYFLLTAIIFCVVYKTFLDSFNQKKKRFWRNIIIIFSIGLLSLYFIKIYMPYIYDILFQTRNELNQYRIGSEDANTIIVNIIEDDGTIITFTLNFIINIFRIMFPVSVIRQGMSQFLFFLYQIILSGKLLILFNNFSKEEQSEDAFISLSMLLAYFIVAVLFEPDYGSVIRHEMAMFPIMYIGLIKKEDHFVKE